MSATKKRTMEQQGDKVESKRINSNQPLLKILIPSYVAGALIGKGGSIFTELKSKYGANIRISSNKECYPGTDERIVVLTGEVDQINDLNSYIMEKMLVDLSERTDERSLMNEGRCRQIKIVLTNAAAGLLIGKGGGTIKAIQEETKAKITIANRDDSSVPGERLLTMFGDMEHRSAACFEVIKKISSDASNMANHRLKYESNHPNLNQMSNFGSSLPINNGNIFDGMQNNMMHAYNDMAPNQNLQSSLKTSVQIQMEVPDAMVGPLLGNQGQNMKEFIQRSRAKLQFSPKNEFAPGTTNRILTITGDMNQSKTAYILVNQKVEQLQSESGFGRPRY